MLLRMFRIENHFNDYVEKKEKKQHKTYHDNIYFYSFICMCVCLTLSTKDVLKLQAIWQCDKNDEDSLKKMKSTELGTTKR